MTEEEILNLVTNETYMIRELSDSDLTSFYNPACPCYYCRKNDDLCDMFKSLSIDE